MGKADSDLKTFTEEKATLEARIVELEKIAATAQVIGEGSIEAGPSSEEFERQAATIVCDHSFLGSPLIQKFVRLRFRMNGIS